MTQSGHDGGHSVPENTPLFLYTESFLCVVALMTHQIALNHIVSMKLIAVIGPKANGIGVMKKFLVYTAAFSAFAVGMASAADLPTKMYTKAPIADPIYNWTGLY